MLLPIERRGPDAHISLNRDFAEHLPGLEFEHRRASVSPAPLRRTSIRLSSGDGVIAEVVGLVADTLFRGLVFFGTGLVFILRIAGHRLRVALSVAECVRLGVFLDELLLGLLIISGCSGVAVRCRFTSLVFHFRNFGRVGRRDTVPGRLVVEGSCVLAF